MLLINDLFSDSDLHRIFCTPQSSGKSGITIISEETQVPSVFPGTSVSWEVRKVEYQIFSHPLFSKSLSKEKMVSFETLHRLLSLLEYTHRGYMDFSTI